MKFSSFTVSEKFNDKLNYFNSTYFRIRQSDTNIFYLFSEHLDFCFICDVRSVRRFALLFVIFSKLI